jgi:hypothetical protein
MVSSGPLVHKGWDRKPREAGPPEDGIELMSTTSGGDDEPDLGRQAGLETHVESEEEVVQPTGWFYTDDEDESVLHGPFKLVQLQGWIDEGHFEVDAIVRSGRDGASVSLSTWLRIAEGRAYTRAEFIDHYGGTKEWDAAATTQHIEHF